MTSSPGLAARGDPRIPGAADAPLLVRALRGEPTPRAPVWLMRQAGRYLPGYQRVRAQCSFLELCRRPDLAAEVSLEPVTEFGVDAAIVFSDILVPLQAMGLPLEFEDSGGPRLPRPIRTACSARRATGPTRLPIDHALPRG